jgi:hypothetical protein
VSVESAFGRPINFFENVQREANTADFIIELHKTFDFRLYNMFLFLKAKHLKKD